MKRNISQLIFKVSLWLKWSLTKKGFWTRAVLCWLISIVLLKFDEVDFYDSRFKIRGQQKVTEEVVLITASPQDFSQGYDRETESLIAMNEFQQFNDGFFWDQKLWYQVLHKILKQNPKSIGVTLYFGENLGRINLSQAEDMVFKNDKVFWATNSGQLDKMSLPFATKADKSNIGHVELLRDEDGVIRRLPVTNSLLEDLAHKMTGTDSRQGRDSLAVINYKGLELFKRYTLSQLMTDEIPEAALAGKTIFIGVDKSNQFQVPTPLGFMNKHELWAQITDNVISNQFIKKGPLLLNSVLLFSLMLLAVFVITHFPQTVSAFIFVWIAALWSAFSLWAFDTFSIWIPLVSPLVLLLLIWILYIGYHVLLIERAHEALQQEQRYLAELEQLKNNFVSLISHDLKTPIAKIQAVLDRLEVQKDIPPELAEDFINLKSYSEELNRYIQSILKVLRVESRDFKILKETADINSVIGNVVERLTPIADVKNISIDLKLEPIFLIEFDVTLMTEVFQNLIENAIKYTSPNGKIHIKTTETDTEVLIEIQDSGEGISQEDQIHIWKKFVRGKTQDQKTKGTGLGLYLVKYFIELHGGNIHLKSVLGQGTVFYVRLPIESTPDTH